MKPPQQHGKTKPGLAERLKEVAGIELSGNAPLDPVAPAQDLPSFLAMAEALARTVASVHARGVTHRDICPDNLAWRDGQLLLCGFAGATSFTGERPRFAPLDRLPRLPVFASPEQSGRMNRPVDQRSDLYSLGATLYALSAGRPPFSEDNALGLVHAHLARAPRPPGEFAPWMPGPVSSVIMRLLAKEPDERYQSAAGLAADLARLRADVSAGRTPRDVPPDAGERSQAPRAPLRLHGRAEAIAVLADAFESVGRGGSACVFIEGAAGAGKTSLANELQRPVTMARGFFARGKFEQFVRQRPLFAPVEALEQLCELLLAEPEEVLAPLRRRLLAKLGQDAGALLGLVPLVGALLGPLPAPPKLAPRESQLRTRRLLVRFLAGVASPGRPLVLALDDLQWADQPSLDFVAALLEDADLDGVVIIATYRDNEIDEVHPLRRLASQSAEGARAPRVLSVGNLPREILEAVVADMLGTDVEETRGLADEVFRATDGNPFYAVEMVHALHREGALRRDAADGRWSWDAKAVAALPASTGVVDFITRDLAALPDASAEVLAAAACLGAECSLDLLQLAVGEPNEVLVARLEPALERGVLVLPDAAEFLRGSGSATVRFCHDRAQQAARQLRDEAWRARFHLCVGRRFVAKSTDPFRAAEHYAAARDLVVSREERDGAASLFLGAARTAREAGAFAEARRFLRLGLGMLGPDPWSRAGDLAWQLSEELHLVCYALSQYGETDALYAELVARAASPQKLVGPTCVQVVSLSNRSRYEEAVHLGTHLAARLGTEVPLENPRAATEEELQQLVREIDGGALQGLAGRGRAQGGDLGPARLMNRMIPAAFFSQPDTASWLVVHCARQWMEHGYDEAFLYPMSCVILATVPHLGDYAAGYRAAQAALEAGQAREEGVETARARHVFALLSCHWFEPLEHALAHAREAHDALARFGEFEFACYTHYTSQAAQLEIAANLGEVAGEHRRAHGFAAKAGNRHALPAYAAFRRLVGALAGTGDAGGEPSAETLAANPMAAAFHHIYRALEAAILMDGEALERHSASAAALIPYITAFYPVALANVLESLALLERVRRGEAPAAARLADNQRWLEARASDAPTNFAHLHDFIEAERYAVKGNAAEALPIYERAMIRAKAHQRPWHLALITERAARCYLSAGLEQAGRRLMEEARSLYLRWGAGAKTEALEREFPFLVAPGLDPGSAQHLMAAAQSLAEAGTLPQLLEKTAEILARVSGATNALILVGDERGRWALWASGDEGRAAAELDDWGKELPASAIRAGLRSMRPVVSDDAVLDVRFARDPYFEGMGRCSLLAVPVAVRGSAVAFAVLENRSVRGAFGHELVSTVEMLCGQMAVSLENARIRSSLESLVEQRTKELRAAEKTIAQTAYELTENIPVGTYTMVQPPDGGMAFFSFLSTRFLELTGLDARSARENPMNAFACVHPDDYEEWVRKNAYVFEHKLPFHEECRVVLEGETRWIVAESTPRDLPDGSVVWEGVLTDITDRKLAEQKLAESEARLRLILNNIPVPVAINDLGQSARITFLNEQFTRAFGYTTQDIPTVRAWAVRAYPDEDYRNATFAIWDAAVAEAERAGAPIGPMEFRVSCKDGSRRDVLINAVVVEEMLLVGFVDITARKKAEEELAEANRNMHLAAATARLGFWEYDAETGLSKWDDEILRMHGMARGDFDGDWQRHIHPDDQERIRAQTLEMVGEGSIFELEFRIVRKDGGVRHVRDHGIVLRDSLGRALRANGVILDITEQREAALREKRMEEEHRLQLETKLKTSLTASAIAHEINQPLSSILLHSRMALKKGADARESLAVVAKEAQRMVATIEKMKALLRNVQTEHTAVDLAQVVKSSLLYTKGPIARAGIKVRRAGLRKACRIEGDDAQLQLAVVNLLRNAIEAIAESGAKKKEISVELVEREGAAELVMGDSGPGWSGAQLEETPLTTTKKEGTGIGLYVVRTTVKNHGGAIAFGRSLLGGAEVRLSFPRRA